MSCGSIRCRRFLFRSTPPTKGRETLEPESFFTEINRFDPLPPTKGRETRSSSLVRDTSSDLFRSTPSHKGKGDRIAEAPGPMMLVFRSTPSHKGKGDPEVFPGTTMTPPFRSTPSHKGKGDLRRCQGDRAYPQFRSTPSHKGKGDFQPSLFPTLRGCFDPLLPQREGRRAGDG